VTPGLSQAGNRRPRPRLVPNACAPPALKAGRMHALTTQPGATLQAQVRMSSPRAVWQTRTKGAAAAAQYTRTPSPPRVPPRPGRTGSAGSAGRNGRQCGAGLTKPPRGMSPHEKGDNRASDGHQVASSHAQLAGDPGPATAGTASCPSRPDSADPGR
jgi:hypothetical protein